MTRYATIRSFSFGKIKTWYRNVTSRFPRKKVENTIRRRPFVSFFATLGVLLLLIILGSLLAPKPEVSETRKDPKEVRVYGVGKGPTIQTQAQVQKTGVIKIYAQTAGIVQKVNVIEGQEVGRGTTLVALSTNYQGGNAAGIQAQIANEQYKNVNETFSTQKEIIQKQHEIANKTDENTDQLRKISEESLNDTRSNLSSAENQLQAVNAQIQLLEQSDPTNPALGGLKAESGQLQQAIPQLRATVRTLEHQTDEFGTTAGISNLTRDVTNRQLDIQEKSLESGREVARLSSALAGVQASLMNPASPSNGTVQRVHVVFGQSVAPGTLLVTIFQPDHEIMAIANISANLATQISQSEMSRINLENGTSVSLAPRFVSTEATEGNLYAVIYTIPNEYSKDVTDQEFVTIDVPLSLSDVSKMIPMVPVDSVYKTESGAYVFVVEKNKVVARSVRIGEIFGSYIEIESGLKEGDVVILDRNVVDGEEVKAQRT
jgi:multidrug efflux pump subunit AcrA (membrane-fusion protein)